MTFDVLLMSDAERDLLDLYHPPERSLPPLSYGL